MKSKLTLFILFTLILSSCATYTISEARDIIDYPENKVLSPTKISTIEENKEKLERAKREAEEEKERIERENSVNEYPESYSSVTLPFYYNPVKNKSSDTIKDTFRAVLIPLGDDRMEDEVLLAVKNSVSDIDCTIIALTGSYYNRSRLSTLFGEDAVTVEGGTIIFKDSYAKDLKSDRITLSLTPDYDLSLLIMDQKPLLPEGGDTDEITSLVDHLEDRDIEEIVEYISQEGSDKKLFFLTSYAPSSSDWTDWTEYSYRKDHSFMISDILSDLKWQDCYDAVRFSSETESGVTRRNGEVEERLDYIWSKGLIVYSSYTVPLEKTEFSAVVATFIIP